MTRCGWRIGCAPQGRVKLEIWPRMSHGRHLLAAVIPEEARQAIRDAL